MTDEVVTPAAPIAPAAPAAPTAPAAPAPLELSTPATAPAPAAFTPTGDPGLDLAMQFASARGIDLKGAAVAAAKDGDFSFLKAELAALGAKAVGYEEFLALAEQSFARHQVVDQERTAQVTKDVHAICGGEQGWSQIQAWASANATPAEKEQINAAFAAGGVQAKAAALYLQRAFSKASGKEPAGVAKVDAGGGTASASNGPLSGPDYAKEVLSLRTAKGGRDVSGTPEYRALQARRSAGMRAGK